MPIFSCHVLRGSHASRMVREKQRNRPSSLGGKCHQCMQHAREQKWEVVGPAAARRKRAPGCPWSMLANLVFALECHLHAPPAIHHTLAPNQFSCRDPGEYALRLKAIPLARRMAVTLVSDEVAVVLGAKLGPFFSSDFLNDSRVTSITSARST